MFKKFFSLTILLSFTLASVFFQSTVIAAPKFCWKDSYGRGAGVIPPQPPKGQFRHWFSAHWYSCPNGYNRSANPDINATNACVKTIPGKEYKARFVGKINKAKPKGSFYDPRKGGEYWSCPSGYNRSLAPVTANNACTKRIGESLKRAVKKGTYRSTKPSRGFSDLGYWWSCPSGYNRTWEHVKHAKACSKAWWGPFSRATKHHKVINSKPSGSFYDPRNGGEYWSCNGWNRTAYAVTSNKACSKAGYTKLSRATFKSKAINKQGPSSFSDPRNGGEYWSCPSGTNRTVLKAVNDKGACWRPAKDSYARATRRGSVCGKDEEQAGLCYKKCKNGYDPVGPVCWNQKAPHKSWKACGAGWAKDDKTCGMVVGSQIAAAAEIALFISSFGSSSAATAPAKATKYKKLAEAKAKLAKLMKNNKVAIDQAKKIGSTAAAYTSAANNVANATTEEDIIRAAADVASLADPSGVSSAVSAYTFPKCSKYASLGAFKGDAKTIKSSASSALTGKVTIGSPKNAEECKVVAKAAKLKLGGAGYKFSSNYTTKGCYYYKSGKYGKRAYWGGTGNTMNSSNVKGAGGKTRLFIDTEKLCKAWAKSKKVNGKTLKWGGSGKYATKGCYYYTSTKYKGKAYFGK